MSNTVINRLKAKIEARGIRESNYELDLAARLEDIDCERELILNQIKKKKKEASKNWLQAKPEEVDSLFCDLTEPCEQTVTLLSDAELTRKAREDYDKELIDTLFCNREEPCEKTVDLTCIKTVSTWGGIQPHFNVKVDPITVETKPVEAYVENKVSHCTRIRKYLSEQWQLVRTSLKTSNSTGQKSS